MRPLVWLVLLPLLPIVSCTQTTEPATDGVLRAEARPPNLHLTNRSRETVYWTVFEADFAARADWAPCTDPIRCPRLEPGETRRHSYSEITGYSASAENAIVFWWHLVPQSGQFTVDRIRALRVRL
jgi:hypothetical protein